jgi:hypothetical protein
LTAIAAITATLAVLLLAFALELAGLLLFAFAVDFAFV